MALLLGAVIAMTAFLFLSTAKANPSFFIRQNNGVSTTATTSPSYMSPGLATTTYYMDTGAASANSTDSAVFTFFFTGSSTASTVNVAFEYASPAGDCIGTPTLCEWYTDDLNFPTATTTQSLMSLTTGRIYSLTFASTTVGGLIGTANRTTRIVPVPTPTRYVRAVVTIPAGSLNGAVWGEFVAKRQ